MGILSKLRKKAKKGAATGQALGTSGKLATSAKLIRKGSKVAKIARVAGVAGAAIGAGLLVEKAAEKLGVRGGAGFIGKRKSKTGRRRGKVPKTVKKWANRITSRRKQEEKIIKDLFGNDGGKIIKKAKKSSSGVITAEEARRALSR